MSSRDYSKLKVAIVHDWAFKIRGAEKCLETFCEIFPSAEIFLLFGDKKAISEDSKIIGRHKITFSWLNNLPFISKFYKYTYFLWPMVVENYDLRDYDLVISSSACVSKGVITQVGTPHICYMHSPMRYAWDQSLDYFNPKDFGPVKRLIISFLLHFIRMWDVTSTSRIDYLVPNSTFVKKRILKYYRKESLPPILPPVYTEMAKYDQKKEDYFLSIAPFEPNKNGRLAVEAAIKSGFNLKILGSGGNKKELESIAEGYKNVEFLGWVTEDEKWDYLSKAKGLLFCGVEDLGIVPLEAIASGTPVVAYKKGGVLDTVIDGVNGIFFTEQTVEALSSAIDKLNDSHSKKKFNTKAMNEYAKQFSKESFKSEVRKLVDKALKDFEIE